MRGRGFARQEKSRNFLAQKSLNQRVLRENRLLQIPPNRRMPLLALFTVVVIPTLIAYWPVSNNDFIDIDDPLYVTSNPHVMQGLRLIDIRWAFTTNHAANWHPLTWLSHMLDCQLWGVNAQRHHQTNVALHIANACLIFAMIRLMGGSVTRSAIVAAIFALHPVHVESVAWAAERKDVLAAFCGLLSICCYLRYARAARGRVWYALVLLTLAMGLLAKPTVVTLPFVFLLLDYWPLARFFVTEPLTRSQRRRGETRRRLRLSVFYEKIPLLALSVGSCVMTFLAQKEGGAVASVQSWPIQQRLANAIVSYLRYLGMMIYPMKLAPFYPLSGAGWPASLITIAALTLISISIVALLRRRQNPYFLIGWLWFLGVLVPAIGLVQVGGQSIADRYMYLPSIGLIFAIVWWIGDLSTNLAAQRLSAACAIAACLASGVLTFRQVGYWKDTKRLMDHTLTVVPDNGFCRFYLGAAAAKNGQADEAIRQFTRAIDVQPNYAPSYLGLGRILMILGRFDEARQWLGRATQYKPDDSWLYWNYGDLSGLRGDWKSAAEAYQRSMQLNPDEPIVIQNLALSLIQLGQFQQAEQVLQRLLQLQPNDLAHHYQLAAVMYQNHQLDAAERELSLVADNAPAVAAPQIQWQLAMLDLRSGKIEQAIPHLRRASELNPNLAPALQNLAWILATHPDASKRDSAQAVHLAERGNELSGRQIPEILDTLAAAYAANAQFQLAIETAQQALALANSSNKPALAREIAERLKRYQAGQSFIDESLASKG